MLRIVASVLPLFFARAAFQPALLQYRSLARAQDAPTAAAPTAAAADPGGAPEEEFLFRHFIDLEKYPLARCLDGTPGYYYIRRAPNAASSQKWHILMGAGGWCNPSNATPRDIPTNTADFAGIDSCYWRATDELGTSSLSYNEIWTENASGPWFDMLLSRNTTLNPMMHDWNVAFLQYCDGGSYSGMKTDTINVWGKELHSKGGFIMEAFKDTLLLEYGLQEATDVVVRGCSAGGLAVYLHLDWWRRALPQSAFVTGLADSGFFLDWRGASRVPPQHAFAQQMRVIFRAINASASVNKDCVAAKLAADEDDADCFFAQTVMPFVKTPIFMSQSFHDLYQIEQGLGLGELFQQDLHDESLVDDYANDMQKLIRRAGFKKRNSNDRAGMIDSCYHHCFKWDIAVNGVRRVDAFDEWYETSRSAWQRSSWAVAVSKTMSQLLLFQNDSRCCFELSLVCSSV